MLHPHISKFIAIARKCFPKGNIVIVTNGILVKSMPESFWSACKFYDAEIRPTVYPIRVDYKKIEEICMKKDVKYRVFNSLDPVYKTGMNRFLIDKRGEMNSDENFKKCWKANHCNELNRGKLYTCDIPVHAHILDDYFNIGLDLNEANGIDIYKVNNGDELISRLELSVPFCKYCDSTHAASYADPWGRSRKGYYEWMKFVYSQDDIERLRQFDNVYMYAFCRKAMTVIEKLENLGCSIKGIIVSRDVDEEEILTYGKREIKELENMSYITGNNACLIPLLSSLNVDLNKQIEIYGMLYKQGLKNLIPIFE